MGNIMSDMSKKATVIVNSIVAVIVTALCIRLWMRLTMKKPPSKVAKFTMAQKDFGDGPETRRDVSRTYAGGRVQLMVDGGPREPLRPPAGLTPGVDTAAVAAHIEAFEKSLKAALPSIDLSKNGAFERLLPMLTVNPALSALAAAGELPMLKNNIFLIVATTPAAGSASLHCLMIGLVGAPPNKPKPDDVLTVASPNLLAASDAALGYEMSYATRRAEKKTLEQEMSSLPGVAELISESGVAA